MTTAKAKPIVSCTGCQKTQAGSATTKGAARAPRGWKRLADGLLCGDCMKGRYMLRAVTIPIAGPLPDEGETQQEAWAALRVALREAWSLTTAASNWMMSELFVRDAKRLPGGPDKMPPMPKVYLYPDTRAKFPGLAAQSAASLEQSMQAKWRAKRYEVLWTGESSVPNYRYPTPMPVPSQGWRAEYTAEGVPLVHITFGGRRWSLRLRGGFEWARQLTRFKQLCGGQALPGEAAIYRVRANPSDGRNGTSQAPDHAGSMPVHRVMLKLVAWVPRPTTTRPKPSKSMAVATASESFWCGVIEGREEPWILHAPHVKDWVHQHNRWLKVMADDSKHERRMPRRRRRKVLTDYDTRGKKYKQRINTWMDQAVAMLVGFAVRNDVCVLNYDDHEAGYLPNFGWFVLREKLRIKLDEAGILFCPASGEVKSKTRAPLANDVTEEQD